MLVAVVFADAQKAEKIANALGRYGLRAFPGTSGAAVLRQSPSVTMVICGARLEDMTALKLRSLLPMDIPMLVPAAAATKRNGIETLPREMTRAQLAETILRKADVREALIARAKRAIIRDSGAGEAAAHRMLQRHAMNHGISVSQAAEEILRKYGEEV